MSGAAFAQSNVQIYGKVDVAYINASTSGGKLSAIDSGAHDNSRIGFKGEEALGNGLKAVFNLEYQLNADQNQGIGTPTGGTQARQQYVGLQGGFGEVIAGRVYAPAGDILMYDSMDATDAFSVFASLGGNPNDRTNNAVAYTSPTFGGGFTAKAIYGFGAQSGTESTVSGSTDDERNKGLGITYANGPVSVSYMMQKQTDIGLAQGVDLKMQHIGGSYDFGAFALQALRSKFDSDTAGADYATWAVGGTVPVSAAGLVRVQYARRNADGNNTDSRGWAIGYDHNLSKRTMIYGGYSRISNDSLAAEGVYFNSVGATAGNSSRLYGVGIRHNF